MARHRAAVTRGIRVSRLTRRLGASAAAIGGAVVVAVLAAGGTYALWSDAMPVQAGTVTAGTAGLTINDVPSYAIPGLDVTKLYPGYSTISAPLTVKNTGNTPLRVTPGTVTLSPSNALATQVVVAVRQASVCTPTPYNTPPTQFTSFRLEPGGTTTICVEVQLSVNAPPTVQGLALNFTAPLVGTQERP